MSAGWDPTPLRKALSRVERFEPRLDLQEYAFAGTYSYARGIFVGERKLGATFKLPKVQRIRAGDFVYCKIMAWEGAFGIVPHEADSCVMSGAFVAYEPNTSLVEPKFLDWYFRAESNWQRVGRQSTGTEIWLAWRMGDVFSQYIGWRYSDPSDCEYGGGFIRYRTNAAMAEFCCGCGAYF